MLKSCLDISIECLKLVLKSFGINNVLDVIVNESNRILNQENIKQTCILTKVNKNLDC